MNRGSGSGNNVEGEGVAEVSGSEVNEESAFKAPAPRTRPTSVVCG